ncbi:pyridoxamine 5'-phosphate oxidase [Chloropicon roscoffensis]|uniref:Pyridoxamine 5'-phosphate oxidase n=1 Tax=Chloropicon roscoffensis TaxID=1461544 RepID=A0AAX4PK13_9CHLO
MVAITKARTIVLACALLVGILGTCPETAYAARKAFRHFQGAAPIPRPPYTDYASMARWLTHMNDWGVIATTSAQTGLPWTNSVDLSDGPVCNSTGRLFFYLTTMDETASDALKNPLVSFTVTEASVGPGGCGQTDAEDPTCAKLTVLGSLAPVPPSEASYAVDLLASRHPAIKSWPANHGFKPYELTIQSLNLLDFYGGMKHVQVDDYFSADLTC